MSHSSGRRVGVIPSEARVPRDPSPPDHQGAHRDVGIRPGDVLAGKYRVERILGAGGMGVVIAAHHIQLDEKVALKFLTHAAMNDGIALARFEREARAAVKIKSEHVARVSDVGRLETGVPFMVMEYLDGHDLAAWVRERGPMPVEQAVDFVLQACEAIAEAHTLGIVHRDLKPANLFCIRRPDGQLSIKVLDFGISKVTSPGAPRHDMTHTTTLIGSPLYMSPEQMKASREVDARTDIWSLAIILYELLSAESPFQAQTVTELAILVANDPPVSIRKFRAEVPAGLESVIERCLEKDRARRYANVGELAVALADYGSPRARASVERILGTLGQAGASTAVLPPSTSAPASLEDGAAATVSVTTGPTTLGSSSPIASARAVVTADTPGGQFRATVASGVDLSPLAPPLSTGPGTNLRSTSASWGQTGNHAGFRTRRTAKVVIAVGSAVGVLALGVVALSLGLRAKSDASAGLVTDSPKLPGTIATEPPPASSGVVPGAAPATAPASASPAPPLPPSTGAPPEEVTADSAARPSAPPPPVSPGTAPKPLVSLGDAPKPPATTGGIRPKATAATPTTKKKNDCDPPYFIDAHGNRIFKTECL
jgi:eukaryotic-like serine/threonine-protein kinase